VDDSVVGSCGVGLLVLAAAGKADTVENAKKLADKVVGLRIFNDAEGRMNLALKDLPADAKPGILAISNFTLYGDAMKSRRPSFMGAAGFEQGEALFSVFLEGLKRLWPRVESGEFGGDMKVELLNDGPVTLIIDC
jgi:D-tyrosyl-tRNA(Tyr) deacylase